MRALGSSYIRLLNESNCIKSCEKRRFWLLIVSLVPPIVVQCAFAIRTLTLGKKNFHCSRVIMGIDNFKAWNRHAHFAVEPTLWHALVREI